MTGHMRPAGAQAPSGVHVCVVLLRVAAVGFWIRLIPAFVASAVQGSFDWAGVEVVFPTWQTWVGLALAYVRNVVFGVLLWAGSYVLLLVSRLEWATNMTAEHRTRDTHAPGESLSPLVQPRSPLADCLPVRKADLWARWLRVAAVVVWFIGVVDGVGDVAMWADFPRMLGATYTDLVMVSRLLGTLVVAFAVGIVLWAASYVLRSLARVAAAAPSPSPCNPTA